MCVIIINFAVKFNLTIPYIQMRHNLLQLFTLVMAALLLTPSAFAFVPDEKDLDPALRLPVRRLHPERPTAAQAKQERDRKKKLKQQQKNVKKQVAQSFGNQKQKERNAREKAYLDSLLAIEYTVPNYSGPVRLTWVEEPVGTTQNELLPLFKKGRGAQGTSYVPNSVNYGNTENAQFFYFTTQGGKPGPLMLRTQYVADDPLNIVLMRFIVNGFEYLLTPQNTQAGQRNNHLYWEVSDQQLTSDDKDLVYALAHASWARVTLVGEDGMNHVKDITDDQIADFQRSLDLYRLLGGSL